MGARQFGPAQTFRRINRPMIRAMTTNGNLLVKLLIGVVWLTTLLVWLSFILWWGLILAVMPKRGRRCRVSAGRTRTHRGRR